jgi:hypothetical protein
LFVSLLWECPDEPGVPQSLARRMSFDEH